MKFSCRLFIAMFFFISTLSATILDIPQNQLEEVGNKFGTNGIKRVKFVNNYFKKNITYKIKSNPIKLINKINNFYNKLTYIEDKNHWRKDDYWASLIEFVASGAGDSEDFAMAKLYTLTQYGIDPNKFVLMEDIRKSIYTKIQDPQHIVLVYKHNKNSKLLILDCINKKLKAVSNPEYLKPIGYSNSFIQKRLKTMLEL